jgi:hypothetical protein
LPTSEEELQQRPKKISKILLMAHEAFQLSIIFITGTFKKTVGILILI